MVWTGLFAPAANKTLEEKTGKRRKAEERDIPQESNVNFRHLATNALGRMLDSLLLCFPLHHTVPT